MNTPKAQDTTRPSPFTVWSSNDKGVGSSESINFNMFEDHIMKDETESYNDKETSTKRKRKERCDKNKRRKHPNRAYNACNSDQTL